MTRALPKPTPVARHDVVAVVAATPCKPRLLSSSTDRLPMAYREGALDIITLPRVENGWRIWPDGRKEKI